MITIAFNDNSFLPKERDKQTPSAPTTDKTEQALGVIERLKDEFGDYTDPLTYDWTWREKD